MDSLMLVYDALARGFCDNLIRGGVYEHLPTALRQQRASSSPFPVFGPERPRPFGGLISVGDWEVRWLEPSTKPPVWTNPGRFRMLVLGNQLPDEAAWRDFLFSSEGVLRSIHRLEIPAPEEDQVVGEYYEGPLKAAFNAAVTAMGVRKASEEDGGSCNV